LGISTIHWGLESISRLLGLHSHFQTLRLGGEDDSGDLAAGERRRHWRLGAWGGGDDSGDLVAGEWKRHWRLPISVCTHCARLKKSNLTIMQLVQVWAALLKYLDRTVTMTNCHYDDALIQSGITALSQRRKEASTNFIKRDCLSCSVLTPLIPCVN